MNANAKMYDVILEMVAETKTAERAVLAIKAMATAQEMAMEWVQRVTGKERTEDGTEVA